ncbi:MAG: helix-turn-helix domain-containing protein [Lachnospiraceae bacterium]|nr:helix-turn-helix domain-containing protein [Lachnospiraceae bacterium]
MVDAVNVEENTTKKFYTAEEVAEILRISRSTAYKYLNSDEWNTFGAEVLKKDMKQ